MAVNYSAGAAVATYDIDLSPMRASIAEAKRLYGELSQAAQQAAQLPRGTSTVVPRSEAPGAINVGSGPGIDKAAVASAKLAQEQSKAALAAQRLATEEQRTAVAAVNVERAESQAASAALRLSQQQQKANDAAVRGQGSFDKLAGGVRGIQSALGAVGIGIGVSQLVQGGIAAGQYSVGVRQTEAVLRQLSGTQGRYNELTAIAAQNQRLFGGTLAENYAPLTGVLSLANQTGASLGQLNSVTQLLLAKAPGKTAGDAFFGLGEFLSGTGAEAALSIADQFNLSKKAVAALAAEGVSAQDRLAGLTKLLAEQGVTSETLRARLTDQAVAYNDAGKAVDNLKLKVGDLLAVGFAPAARGLTMVLNVVDESTTAMNRAGNGETKTAREVQANELVQGAKDYESYIARLRTANQSMPWGQGFYELSAAQYTATRAALDHTTATMRDADAQAASAAANAASTAANAESAAAAFGSVNASNAHTLALRQLSQATQDSITKQIDAIGQDREMAGYKAELAFLAGQVAAGLMRSGDAALIMGRDYTIAASQAAALIAQQAALAPGGVTEARLERPTATDNNAARIAIAEKAAAIAQARRDQLVSTGSATQVVSVRQQQLNEAIAQYGRNSAQAIDAQTALIQAQRQLAAERTRAGASADKLATKDATAANAEAVAQRDAMRRIETMTQDHYDKLRSIQEDYALSSSRRTEDYQIARQRLLADGQIKEAQLLEAKFALDQRRAAEDNARARSRETDSAAQGIADAQAQAGLKADDRERRRLLGGVAIAGALTGGAAAQAQAEAALAATAGQRPASGLLRIEFAPISLVADGVTLASVVYPALETRIDAFLAGELATLLVTAPPAAGQGAGVGGPRP